MAETNAVQDTVAPEEFGSALTIRTISTTNSDWLPAPKDVADPHGFSAGSARAPRHASQEPPADQVHVQGAAPHVDLLRGADPEHIEHDHEEIPGVVDDAVEIEWAPVRHLLAAEAQQALDDGRAALGGLCMRLNAAMASS